MHPPRSDEEKRMSEELIAREERCESSSCLRLITFCKSAMESSNTRPLSPSEAICEEQSAREDDISTQRLLLNADDGMRPSTAYIDSAREGGILPMQGQHLTLVPVVLVTRVFPTWRTWKVVGALISYQSFLAKGSAREAE